MQTESLGIIRHFTQGMLHFVEGKLDIGLEQASPLIAQCMDYVAQIFPDLPLQILDCPPGTACAMIAAVKTADYVVLISEPTPFGMHDLILAVETVQQLKIPFGVVINRDGIGTDDIYRYLEREEIELLAKIPNKRQIAEIYSEGGILFDKVPELKVAIEAVLKKIEGFE